MLSIYLISELNLKMASSLAAMAPVPDDGLISYLVNNLPLTVREDQDAKTMLSIYCQQNNLSFPEYKVTLVNPNSEELRMFKARINLNGRWVVGNGKTPKKAEMAAARKYLNNNFIFMSGENSLQAEIEIPSQKKNQPPKKLRKNQRRMDVFNARKKADSEAEASKSVEEGNDVSRETPDSIPKDDAKRVYPGLLVYYDLERATGSEASEIIQLAYCCQSGCGSSNIIPKGKIDAECARKSHKISFNGKNLVRNGEILASVSLKKACEDFISFLSKLKSDHGSKPILVSHGTDCTTLMNNFALVKQDEVLVESLRGAVDFVQVIKEDGNYPHASSTMSLTKVNPKKPNLSETVLGKELNKNDLSEAHDASYDARLLMRVVEKYCKNSSDMDLMVDTYIRDSDNVRNQVMYHLSTNKSRKKRRDQTEYYTFYGWE